MVSTEYSLRREHCNLIQDGVTLAVVRAARKAPRRLQHRQRCLGARHTRQRVWQRRRRRPVQQRQVQPRGRACLRLDHAQPAVD